MEVLIARCNLKQSIISLSINLEEVGLGETLQRDMIILMVLSNRSLALMLEAPDFYDGGDPNVFLS